MNLQKIETVEDLKHYLGHALELEHATIPPYLTALYSILPGTNSDSLHILRVVAVEEMLHLTLVANMLNSIGGTADLTAADFVPEYPTYLPDGEKDFQVNLERFSLSAINNFLQIERPAPPQPAEKRTVKRPRAASKSTLLKVSDSDPELHFYSIGEFYAEIGRGFDYLNQKLGPKLFSGDPARQITPQYYYSGGGAVIPVVDLKSAQAALRLIAEQGEGEGGGIYNNADELAHYFRFQQITLGRYYERGDKPDHPSGPPLDVDFSAAYPIKANARITDYPAGSELYAAAVDFNEWYHSFLEMLTQAYGGKPEVLLDAVPVMFQLKQKAAAIIRNPIPNMDGVNAAPIFTLLKPKEK